VGKEKEANLKLFLQCILYFIVFCALTIFLTYNCTGKQSTILPTAPTKAETKRLMRKHGVDVLEVTTDGVYIQRDGRRIKVK
jgi:hypothetical protein